jgi:hypothetical protein
MGTEQAAGPEVKWIELQLHSPMCLYGVIRGFTCAATATDTAATTTTTTTAHNKIVVVVTVVK